MVMRRGDLKKIADVADEYDNRARALREGANMPGIDTNSRLAASMRGRAKSYTDAAITLRAKFKIPQQGENHA